MVVFVRPRDGNATTTNTRAAWTEIIIDANQDTTKRLCVCTIRLFFFLLVSAQQTLHTRTMHGSVGLAIIVVIRRLYFASMDAHEHLTNVESSNAQKPRTKRKITQPPRESMHRV